MCEVCRQTPHLKRCPNYKPPKAAYYCSICGEGIYEGEEYIKNLDSEYAHYDCLNDLSCQEIIKWLGEEVKTMEEVI